MVIGFIEHLQNVTTNNYDSFTELHTLKITVTTYSTHNVFLVFLSRCFVAASKGGCSHSSGFMNCPRPQLPASNSNSSQGLDVSSSLIHQPTLCAALHITSRHGPRRKHRFTLFLYPIVPWKHACFRSYYWIMVVYAGFAVLVLSKYATILKSVQMIISKVCWSSSQWKPYAQRHLPEWKTLPSGVPISVCLNTVSPFTTWILHP
jgi:hypothetical protein